MGRVARLLWFTFLCNFVKVGCYCRTGVAQKTSKKRAAFRTGTSKLWSFKKAAQGGCLLQNHQGSHLPIQVVVAGCWKRAISMTNHWICRFCQVRLSVLEMCCSTCSHHWKQVSGEKERSQSRRAKNKRVEKEKPRNQNAGSSKTDSGSEETPRKATASLLETIHGLHPGEAGNFSTSKCRRQTGSAPGAGAALHWKE